MKFPLVQRLLVLWSWPAAAPTAEGGKPPASPPNDDPKNNGNGSSTLPSQKIANRSHVLVRFAEGTTNPSFLPGTPKAKQIHAGLNIYVADIPPGIGLSAALAQYDARGDVEYAQLDYEVQAVAMPNDPLYASHPQWDMTIIDADLAWDIETDASDVVVAVVDTGIQFDQ